jgi:CheY-like chemotaxis protein
LSGVKALVVDDDPDSREVIATQLEQHGATVVSAGSAAEAFALARIDVPHVMLVDLAMPNEDGYSFIRNVRSCQSAMSVTPAAALTALASDSDREQALAAGFQMHLAKPINSATLISAVAQLSEGIQLQL